MPHENEARMGPAGATPAAPQQVRESGSKLPTIIAIGSGATATFVWTAIATLNSPGRPGTGVNLNISVLVGLIGTAVGAFIGLFIERLRR